jgi:hypothetical protein
MDQYARRHICCGAQRGKLTAKSPGGIVSLHAKYQLKYQ